MKLLFIDDAYPDFSTFRILEGNMIFKYFPQVTHVKNLHFTQVKPKSFDLAYVIGLDRCYSNLRRLHQYKIPFCFELYPGFGFYLGNLGQERQFLEIVSSPYFKGVVTTMPISKKYVEKRKIPNDKHCYVWGGLINPEFYHNTNMQARNKPKVIFCAFNDPYGNNKEKKGFNIFYKAAVKFPEIQFEAYGEWRCDPLPNLKILGNVDNEFLMKKAYHFGDIFFSCTKVWEGEWDGFPTSAAAEASMAGCCLIASDPLGNNVGYTDGKDIILCNKENVMEKLEEVLRNDEKRMLVSTNGRETTFKLFNLEEQFLPRRNFFTKIYEDSLKVTLDETIPGWMRVKELQLIAEIASKVPENGSIVEIGSFAGRSTFHWLANSLPSVKITCIDPFLHPIDPHSKKYLLGDQTLINQGVQSYDLFKHYTKSFDSRIELIRKFSPLEEWNELVDVVFIDGDHSTLSVLKNLKFWVSKVKAGGRILGHDFDMPSVKKALKIFGKKGKKHASTNIWEIEV